MGRLARAINTTALTRLPWAAARAILAYSTTATTTSRMTPLLLLRRLHLLLLLYLTQCCVARKRDVQSPS